MPNKNISCLYNLSRFPQDTLGLVLFIAYLPIGLVLLLLRTLIGLQVFVLGFILPDAPVVQRLLSKLFCLTLGISIDVKNPEKKETVEAYVSNCLTPFDQLALYSCTGSVAPGSQVCNSLLSTALGLRCFSTSSNVSDLKKNILDLISKKAAPVYFQPEGKVTNGKAILKFKTWPFELCTRVQPVSVEVLRPFLEFKVTAFDSTYWTDVIAYMFSPCTFYRLKFLPSVAKMTLSDVEYAERVRQDLAQNLQVELSEYSAADLEEWEKKIIEEALRRQREEMLRPSTTAAPTANNEIQRMARQVKEVLPMVPLNTICTDLMRTWNVDHTITNILEGHVTYVPEPASTSTSTTSASTSRSSTPSHVAPSAVQEKLAKQEPLSTAAALFGKNAQERTLSFQERKRQLIEASRQRYIEKHGLKLVGRS